MSPSRGGSGEGTGGHRPPGASPGVQDRLVPVQLQLRFNRFSAGKRSKIHQLMLMKTKNKWGRGTGANRCPQMCRAAPRRAGTSPPGSPAQPPLPETGTDSTRLSNGITKISSQLSPDAPAVKTNPNYRRLMLLFCVTGAIKSSGAQSTGESRGGSSCSAAISSSA